VKELINSYQDKRSFFRRARDATAIAGVLVALTACEQQPQTTNGTIYQKEHTKTYYGNDYGKIAHIRQETEREVFSMSPIHEERGTDKETMSRLYLYSFENWKVYIAQCPKGALPQPDRIKEECKTSSFDVPQEVYPSLKIGQHAELKQPK
jgi:hypothetical protein